jgi:choline dehydrogenase
VIGFQLWDSYFAPFYDIPVVTILAALLRPKSRGTIQLRSSNPYDHPLIDPKYLSHEDDVATLIKGIICTNELILLIHQY